MLHFGLFFLLLAALPKLWFALLAALVLGWQWHRAEAHLRLADPKGFGELRHGETGWALADTEGRWHEGAVLHRHFLSRSFLVLGFTTPDGRRYRQFLTPGMCGEEGFRALCRVVHLRRKEEPALLP